MLGVVTEVGDNRRVTEKRDWRLVRSSPIAPTVAVSAEWVHCRRVNRLSPLMKPFDPMIELAANLKTAILAPSAIFSSLNSSRGETDLSRVTM